MEHIVNLSFAISDDDIERRISEQMTKAAKERVEKALYDKRYYDSDYKVIELAKKEINTFIDNHSDEIISGVVNAISETLPKRKFFKDAITAAVKEE